MRPTLPWPTAAVDCPACGAAWRERTARFCGHCGAALEAPGPPGGDDRQDDSAPGARAVPAVAIVVIALVGVGLTLWVSDLPTFGIGQPDDIALPGATEADDLAAPQRDLTDAAGNPRCHTDTYAFDCVTGAFTFELGGLHALGGRSGWAPGLQGVRPTGDRPSPELVAGAFGIAAVDVSAWEVVWRWSAERQAQTWHSGRDDLVLASDGEALLALERDTGEIRWRQEDVDGAFGNMWVTSEADAPVLVRSEDVDSARLTALDPAEGSQLWTARIGEDDHPTVGADDTVLVTRYRGVSAHPGLVVLDATDGTELWSREEANPAHAAAPGVPSVLVTPDGLVAVDPRTGEPQWRRDGARTIGWPAEPLLVTEPDSGRVLRLDVASGEVLWDAPLPTELDGDDRYGTWAQVSDGVAYVNQQAGDGLPGGLAAVDVETGEVRWSRSFEQAGASPALTGPVAVDDRLLVTIVRDGSASAAELVAVERDTGRTRWTVSLDDPRTFAVRQTDELVLVPRESALEAHDADTGELAWRIEHDGLHPISVDPLLVTAGEALYRLDPSVPGPGG